MARAHRITAAAANAARWAKHHDDPNSWFWNWVDRSAGDESCWPWLGTVRKTRRGYGRVRFKGRYLGAHRMALTLAKGEPPSGGLFACHACDNPICCNPAHLWWGTPAENSRDAVVKRRSKGAPPKINVVECAELRAAGRTYKELAERYRVNQSSIGKALQRLASLRALQEKDIEHG